jgi:hypothetical protein
MPAQMVMYFEVAMSIVGLQPHDELKQRSGDTILAWDACTVGPHKYITCTGTRTRGWRKGGRPMTVRR